MPISQVAVISQVVQQLRTETLPYLQTETRSAFARLRDELPEDDRALLVLRVDRSLAWEDIARVFLSEDALTSASVTREAARLRKRFQLVKLRLRARGQELGLIADG